MPLQKRILRVTLEMPNGDVVLDETLDMHIRIEKAALVTQQHATIDVAGLSQNLREALFSNFSAWNKRQSDINQPRINQSQNSANAVLNWINVKIEAGYATPATTLAVSGSYATPDNQQTAVIFKGQVVSSDLIAGPPDITTRLTCASRQIDKTAYVSSPAPTNVTFYEYVKWAAQEMGFGANFVCETSFNDQIMLNPGRGMYTHQALLLEIQSFKGPDVAAFVDDDLLIVKDRNKVINPSDVANLNQFIGPPQWNEYGACFVCMFTGLLRLAGAANIESKLNPGVSGTYVITSLTYDLASRAEPFYVTATGGPPA